MQFLILFVYLFVSYGIANTIIYGHGPFHCFDKMHVLFEKIHPQLNEMFSCFICLPWWIGFFFSSLTLLFIPSLLFTPMSFVGLPIEYWYVTVFLDGAFTSGAIWFLNNVEEALERSNGGE